jgi:hypothetical protein
MGRGGLRTVPRREEVRRDGSCLRVTSRHQSLPMCARVNTGGCLCRAVRYEVRGPLRDVVACHCTMCRKTSGSFVHTTAARLADFRLTEQRGLTWYRSSLAQRRGFCKICGGNLFGQENEGTIIYIAAGSLDGPTGLKLAAHIFVADKADYYRLDDGLPRHDDGEHGIAIPELIPKR